MPGAGPRTSSSLGLPEQVRACLFDLDGVLTETAKVHAAAWKEMFDAFLKARADKGGEPFVAFDEADYDSYVDGKTRADGTRSFLESRHIDLPDGDAGDLAGAPTVSGLGEAKNDIVLRMIRDDGVDAYPGSVRYLRAAVSAGLRRAVVSSSANCAAVLEAAGVAELFDVRIDGVSVEEDHLAWCTPAPARGGHPRNNDLSARRRRPSPGIPRRRASQRPQGQPPYPADPKGAGLGPAGPAARARTAPATGSRATGLRDRPRREGAVTAPFTRRTCQFDVVTTNRRRSRLTHLPAVVEIHAPHNEGTMSQNETVGHPTNRRARTYSSRVTKPGRRTADGPQGLVSGNWTDEAHKARNVTGPDLDRHTSLLEESERN